jgi:nitrite reductase (NADH) small subunit
MKRTDAPAWQPVCSIDDILPDTGVCALVNGASVLSRGLVGNVGERIVVASPLYKHHFDLLSGECLEMPEHSVAAYPVRLEDDTVLVAV